MSEVAAGSGVGDEATAAESVAGAAAQSQASAGELLRQAREAAGVELGALAVALKVSVKKLEALEADQLDLLPDSVFVRALASSVCRALKIDAAEVLARLPQSVAPRLQYDAPGLNTPFHTPGDMAKTPFWDRLSRPMVLAALAVLMGTLVLIFFPSSEQRAEIGAIVARAPAPPAAAEVEPEPVAVQAAPAVTPPVAMVAPKVAPMPSAKAVVPPPPPKAPPAAPAPIARPVPVATAVPAPAPVPAAAPTVAATPAAAPMAGTDEPAPVRKKLPSTGVVVFKTSQPSWIEVTDGRGAVQLSRMVEPGEPVGASGPLPLSVSIGRADVTEVLVRGKPFPLEPVTRQGVARFEVQ